MKLVIPGGSGHVGRVVASAFTRAGHEVVALSRRPRPEKWRSAHWDGATRGEWARELEGADVVLNLAGHSVDCRYTPANRARILGSRLESTRAVGDANCALHTAAAHLAASEHRDDLCAHVRRAARRKRRARRRRARRARHVALQHRCREALGTRARRSGDAAYAKARAA